MRKLIFFISLLSIVFVGCDSSTRKPGDTVYPKETNRKLPSEDPAMKPNAEVVGINDGDTITVRMDSSGRQERIRLATIDAPEMNQPFGQASKQSLSSLVFGKKVKVVEMDRDRYERVVAEIFVNGTNVNLEQIKRGFAWHYKQHERQQTPEMRQAYSFAEESARRSSLGLWRMPDAVAPWEWRKER